MVQNWRNYAAYYVIPYIGQRDVQDIDGAVCDALYAKLLAEGRVKARPKKKPPTQAVHMRRLAPDGQVLPCRPHGYDTVRCYRSHSEDDPALGQPIEAKRPSGTAVAKAREASRRKLPPGLEPKTVVNTHRMLHRAWEDFAVWGWAKRNVVSRRASASGPAQGPQGLDRGSAPDVPAARTVGPVLRAVGARSYLGHAALRAGGRRA